MLVTYPAIFYYDENETVKYFVYYPDLDTQTQGVDIPDAMAMASDLLGLVLSDDVIAEKKLPTPSEVNALSPGKNNPFKDDKDFEFYYDEEKSFVSLVSVDLTEYIDDMELIKKTLTIPKWADKAGKKLGLNFSKTLTDAILRETLSS